MKTNRQEAARRKLLGILPRATLEQLCELERPHLASRADLVARIVRGWNAETTDDVLDALVVILRVAGGGRPVIVRPLQEAGR